MYFIVGSAGLMALWLIAMAARYGLWPQNLGPAGRGLGKHAVVMRAVYALTLGIAKGMSRLAAQV
jgi:hypothetical protein